MKHFFSGLLVVLLAAIFAGTCRAENAAQRPLEEQIADFRAEYGLDEQNFSLSYYNTVTGESYGWNDTHFMIAASTFKLPLNLYYYEMEHDGEIRSDARIAGTTLADCHYQSLVWSNNEVSIAMLYRLGDFRTYKQLMRKYFTMDDSQIDPIYYQDNYYCTSMMLDCLKYLYAHSDEFPEMLEYLEEAQPGAYFKRDVKEYAIAHKYGFYEDAVNDVGIVYTTEPFLLAVYTAGVGEDVVAAACRLLTSYTAAQYDEELLACMAPAEDSLPASAEDSLPANAQPAARTEQPTRAAETGPEALSAAVRIPEDAGKPAAGSSPWLFVLIGSSVLLAADCAVLVFCLRHR